MRNFKKGTYNKHNWLNIFRGDSSLIHKYKILLINITFWTVLNFFFFGLSFGENFRGLVFSEPSIYLYGVHSEFVSPIYHWHYMITSYEVGHTSCFLHSAEFVLALRGFNRYGFRVSEKSVRNSFLDNLWRRPRDLVKCSLNQSTFPPELSENCQFLKRATKNARAFRQPSRPPG